MSGEPSIWEDKARSETRGGIYLFGVWCPQVRLSVIKVSLTLWSYFLVCVCRGCLCYVHKSLKKKKTKALPCRYCYNSIFFFISSFVCTGYCNIEIRFLKNWASLRSAGGGESKMRWNEQVPLGHALLNLRTVFYGLNGLSLHLQASLQQPLCPVTPCGKVLLKDVPRHQEGTVPIPPLFYHTHSIYRGCSCRTLQLYAQEGWGWSRRKVFSLSGWCRSRKTLLDAGQIWEQGLVKSWETPHCNALVVPFCPFIEWISNWCLVGMAGEHVICLTYPSITVYWGPGKNYSSAHSPCVLMWGLCLWGFLVPGSRLWKSVHVL